ncbi:MAG: TlpA family protein disulfide reductase [Ignavibacteriaceae bacterium]|nr:TlpA family protein disulfide reductase [Ignavibacteriaceae bacterium]
MKYFFINYVAAFLIAIISFAKSGYKSGHEEPLIGTDAPPFTYHSYEGKEVTLNQYKGKLLLLDFWETWCGKCVSSFQDINKLAKEYKNRGLEVIGITTENRTKANRLIKSNKLVYTNIFADTKVLKNYQVSSRPTYILINEEGEIIFISYGNLKMVENELKRILNKKIK